MTGLTWVRFSLAASLLAGAGLFLQVHSQEERRPQRTEMASFPLRFGDWVGQGVGIKPEVREMLGEGDFLLRTYQRSSKEPYVNLFIAYFPTQRTGSTIHSPQNCLPGAGWTPVDHNLIPLTRPDGAAFNINRYVVAKGVERNLVLYWYQAHGRIVASEYWAKYHLVADAIRLNRSDGALIRIITPLRPDESLEFAEQRAIEFAQQIIPSLDEFIPR